ncbi:MAG: DUF1285 domain-containing protein [Geminicoccaceae bacterium]
MSRKPFDPAAVLAGLAGGPGCGDFEMRIDRAGSWHYRGSPIGRLPLVKLFATVLHRAPDGAYWLVTPAEQGRVTVEDVPFVVVELRREGEGSDQALDLRTNIDDWVQLGRNTGWRLGDDGEAQVPYVEVRSGLEARVGRNTFYELADLATADGPGDTLGVWSRGRFFTLGETAVDAA